MSVVIERGPNNEDYSKFKLKELEDLIKEKISTCVESPFKELFQDFLKERELSGEVELCDFGKESLGIFKEIKGDDINQITDQLLEALKNAPKLEDVCFLNLGYTNPSKVADQLLKELASDSNFSHFTNELQAGIIKLLILREYIAISAENEVKSNITNKEDVKSSSKTAAIPSGNKEKRLQVSNLQDFDKEMGRIAKEDNLKLKKNLMYLKSRSPDVLKKVLKYLETDIDFNKLEKSDQENIREILTKNKQSIDDSIIITRKPGKEEISENVEKNYNNFLNKISKIAADLKTAQGIDAEMFSAKVDFCLISSLCRMEDMQGKSEQQQFEGVINVVCELLKNTNFEEESERKMLDALIGLLHKGFNPEIGGIGCFLNKTGWEKSWNEIGKKGKSFEGVSSHDRAELIKDAEGMLNFYRKNAEAHFRAKERHPGGKSLAKTQIFATLGQLFEDFIFNEKGYSEIARKRLNRSMEKNGLIRKSMAEHVLGLFKFGQVLNFWKSQIGFSDKIQCVRNNVRSSPLFAEVSNKVLIKELADHIRNSDKLKIYFKNELVKIYEDNLNKSDKLDNLDKSSLEIPAENEISENNLRKLNSQIPNKEGVKRLEGTVESHLSKLVDASLDKLSNKLVEEFAKKIEEMPIKSIQTGKRGRVTIGENENSPLRKVGSSIIGHKESNKLSIALAPHRMHDETVDEFVLDNLRKVNQEGVVRLEEAVKKTTGGGIFDHAGSPEVALRLSYALASEIRALLEQDNTCLQEAVLTIIKESPEEEEVLLKSLLKELKKKDSNDEYRDIVKEFKLTFNKKSPDEKLGFEEFSKHKTVSGILYDHNIRTVCSISGTTLDIILGKFALIGEEESKKVLEPFMKYLNGDKKALNSPEGEKFKRFLSETAIFMQAGQYHSVGEVLGGIYVAARGLFCTKEENNDVKKTFDGFEKLVGDFSANPENFLEINDRDKEQMSGALEELRENLIAQIKLERFEFIKKQELEKPISKSLFFNESPF